MPCSTEFAFGQLHAMAVVKRSMLAKIKMSPQDVAPMCQAWAGKMASRFDGETVARACDWLAYEFKGWPEANDVLDACAAAHNEHAKRVEDHHRRDRGDRTLADALIHAGLPVNALKRVQMSRWVGLFEIHHGLQPSELREIVEQIKAGDQLIMEDQGWRMSARSEMSQDGAVRIAMDVQEIEAQGTIKGKPVMPALAKLGRTMIASAGYDPETAARRAEA